VAVDQVGTTRFANVLRDGAAWADFLPKCGFEVTHLTNPTHQEIIDACNKIRFAGSPDRLPYGTGPKSGRAPKPAADTCLFFFFSGGGIKDGSDLLLLPSDSMNRKELVVRERAIDVAMLTTVLREAAAASLLVLDTAFPVPGAG